MRRHGQSPGKPRHSVAGNAVNTNAGPNSGMSRVAPSFVPYVPPDTSIRSERSAVSTLVASRAASRLNSTTPIIMTKAQLRRKATNNLSSTNAVRSVTAAEGGAGPSVTARNVTPSSTLTPTTSVLQPQPGRVAPTRVASKRRFLSTTTSSQQDADASTSSELNVPIPMRVIRTRARARAEQSQADRSAASLYAIQQRYRRIRNRVSFALPDFSGKDSVTKVLMSEKILPRILSLMNWNELLPLRLVCKTWFETIESNPKVNLHFGIITLRSSIEGKMAVYNASSVTWTKFRFIGPAIFDMTKPIQNEFWNKHGPMMTHLEINNRAMSLTGLVEILARCPKLEFFKCNWTPEMYSFNSELIRKYYGIHFNNGTFANLHHLIIECSSSLTDSALASILKWCGGSLRSLTLTSPPDEDILTRLKPRWSIESIRNYFERFGYTGNLQYLDFSWSNLTANDVRSLCFMEMHLRGITLNYCRLEDEALRKILLKHGETLELFKIEGTPFTEAIFQKAILPKVKVLHIGGVKGNVQSLGFLKDMPYLEELSCHHTLWLEQNMILRPFNSKIKQNSMKRLDLGGSIKHSGNKNIDPTLNKTWFSDFTGLIVNVTDLNLSQWSVFGTNMNFRNICHTLTLLEKLVLRDWEQLNDVGTTGLYEEEIHQDWGTRVPLRNRVYVGQLEQLKVLDLSGTAITDATVYLALCGLKNLRSLAIEGTRITDSGLKGLITKIPTLDRISVAKCPRISNTQPRFKRPDGRTVILGKL